jgi:DNA-damage-inducible protein J
MPKTAMIRARVEPELKAEAEEVLHGLGLTSTEAITLFYRQLALQRGLPFAVRLPNALTREALRQAVAGEDLTEWPDLEALHAAHR